MDKFKIIYEYILGNDEVTNQQRFEIAWDIVEQFGKIREEIKRQLAVSVEKRLSEELDDNWEVSNTFNEGCWNKHSAGVFIRNKKWIINEHKILIGIQADGQEFNNLYLCIKYHTDISNFFEKDFNNFETVSHWFQMKREWLDEAYRDTWKRDFLMKVTTKSGKQEIIDYYVNKIYEFQIKVEPKINNIIDEQ
ncbi:MAG: hypothetical protein GY749_35305 [Desulfobacteraceae bacterium]|nr:hypothetical protein [Desulfobacteraceae bacterium]